MRYANLCFCLLLTALITGCGEESESSQATSPPDGIADTVGADGSEVDATLDTSQTQGCPPGQIQGTDATCTTIGIPNCADLFMNADSGFCEPSIDLCVAGQYPNFETGCVQAGIADCATEFVDAESGLCMPSPEACDPGFIAVPTQGCVSLDPADGCGEGTWGNITEVDGDHHVDQGYGGGGSDGSRAKPWTQISQAQASLASGGRIILAAGDYDESVFFETSASIIGRCSSMVTVSGATTSPLTANLGKTVLEIGGQKSVTVSDLRVSGDGIGLAAYLGAQVNLERVIFDANEFFGIFISGTGSVVNATDILVNGTRDSTNGMAARGVSAQDGGALHLERGMLTNNSGTNVLCGGSLPNELSTMTLKDVLISGAQPIATNTTPQDIYVNHGATATLEDTVIFEHAATGLMVAGAGTSVTADGLVISGSKSSDVIVSEGINLQDGASAVFNHVAIHEARDIGLYITDEDTAVEAQNLMIAHTQPTADTASGMAVLIRQGGALTLDSGALIANQNAGITVRSFATANLSGLLVEGTQATAGNQMGSGIEAFNGAEVTVERSALMQNMLVSIVAILQPTTFEFRDSIIAHTLRDSVNLWGRGIQVQAGASLVVERCAIIDNYETAVFILEALGEIRDTLLADTKETEEGQIADGLLATLSEVTASGVSATGNQRVGVLFDQTEGSISGCSISDNAFGLATQGTDVPMISDNNAIVDNDKNLVENNALSIPDQPMELPQENVGNE